MSERTAPRAVFRQFARSSATATLLLAAVAVATPGQALDVKETLRFAADMAERGNWREARYRWDLALAETPDSGRVLNNLGVAAEAMGEPDAALDYYEQALVHSPREPRILDNARRLQRLREQLRERAGATTADSPTKNDSTAIAAAPGTKSTGGKPELVQVAIPIPPRLQLEGVDTLLVASFLTDQIVMLDVNRELVRFLRSEFRKQTDLDVLDVVPPPAIPEQTAEDLVRNDEFWKYLAREHGADLIVSGVVSFGRFDVSGFQEVDIVSPRTGQKIRQTQFVEQEKFSYTLDIFFMDGVTGGLLFRDRMSRNVIFRGLMNDPIHAFYELSESIAGDVLSVVTTHTRVEPRTIFRR